MRLIDELLKDDFFNGGYKPPAAPSRAYAGKKGNESGKNSPILLYITLAVLLLAASGAAAWFFLGTQGGADDFAEISPGLAGSQLETIDPLPTPAAAEESASAMDGATDAEAPITDDGIATGEKEQARAKPPADTADPGPQAPSARASAPPARTYALAFPPFSDRNEVERLASGLRERGLTTSISTSEVEITRFAVLSPAPVDEDEASAIRLKASVLDLTVEFRPAGDGRFTYSLGRFDDADQARAVGASAREVDIPIRLGRYQTDVERYHLEAGGITERQAADRQIRILANEGIQARVTQVDP